MAARPEPRPGIMQIDAYVPGKSAASGVAKIHKLSSNETPLGPSPKAIEAIRTFEHLELYPDGSATRLREAIGAKYGLDPARILCGSGSDELLSLIASTYVGPGDEGIFSEHGFLVYRIAILAAGGVPVVADEKNYTANVDAMLAKVTPKTKIVFLANPNNPTGTYLPFDEVKRLHAGLPSHVVLVLDAAYAEYVRRNDYEAGLELVATTRKRRDDADLLEDLRPGQHPARLDGRAGACRRCGQSHSRPLQRERSRNGGRNRCDPGRRACVQRRDA